MPYRCFDLRDKILNVRRHCVTSTELAEEGTLTVSFIVCHRDAFVQQAVQVEGARDLDPIPFVLIDSRNAELIPPELHAFVGYDSNLGYMMDGLSWAVHKGADVANMSIGPLPPPDGQLDLSDPLIVATRAVWLEGMLVVVAAGNHGPSLGTLGHLALSPWVLS